MRARGVCAGALDSNDERKNDGDKSTLSPGRSCPVLLPKKSPLQGASLPGGQTRGPPHIRSRTTENPVATSAGLVGFRHWWSRVAIRLLRALAPRRQRPRTGSGWRPAGEGASPQVRPLSEGRPIIRGRGRSTSTSLHQICRQQWTTQLGGAPRGHNQEGAPGTNKQRHQSLRLWSARPALNHDVACKRLRWPPTPSRRWPLLLST